MNNELQEKNQKGDSKKIYLLIAVILLLLGTNVYLFVKNKKTNTQIVTISDEKTKMQGDIDRIELALDSANQATVKISDQMKAEQDAAHAKIAELRSALKRGELTRKQLIDAQKEIKKLRNFVAQYTAQIDDLKKQNANLTTERNTLKTEVDSVSQQAGILQKQNEYLVSKVKAGAALKAGNVEVVSLKVRKNGKEVESTKDKQVSKLRINFTISSNSLAEKGEHTIFVRVIDANGNFIEGDKGPFTADGNELLYTYKTSIEFTNDDKAYSLDWVNPIPFQPGAYTVVLYSEGDTMGKGTVTLR